MWSESGLLREFEILFLPRNWISSSKLLPQLMHTLSTVSGTFCSGTNDLAIFNELIEFSRRTEDVFTNSIIKMLIKH